MEKTRNIYDQQVDEFICRAQARLGELTAARCEAEDHCSCGCDDLLIEDLLTAVETLSNCNSCLTDAQRLRIVQVMSSRADLSCRRPSDTECGIIVQGGAACSGGTGGIRLPLTGEQVIVRTPGGVTKNLQVVINELYDRQQIYYIDGGSAVPNFHPSIP